MKRLLLTILFLGALTGAGKAQTRERLSGWCEQGNWQVTTDGRQSTTRVQRSYPSCTVTVYDAGTTDLASIASDYGGTPKSNPFTASSTGFWDFFAVDGRYDVRLSGSGISSPFTIPGLWVVHGGGGGGGAPIDATYVVMSLNSTLTAERRLTAGDNITITDGGANGNVTITAEPTDPGNPNTSIQSNQGGTFYGDLGLLYNFTTDTVTIGESTSTDGTFAFKNSVNSFITSLRAGTTPTSSFSIKLFQSLPAGSAECVQINSSGQLSTTGSACGSGGGGSVTGSGTPTEMAYWTAPTVLGSAPAVFVNANNTIEFRKATYSLPATLVDGATIASDWRNSTRFRVTIAGNRTLSNPSNAADSEQVVYEILQDGSGGHSLAFDTKFGFGDQISTCVVNTNANKRSIISVIYNQSADKFFIVSCVTGY